MSLSSSGPTGGKGVDAGAVETYDSGDEWDIGVGNLIIDLDADLEKDKLEMSGSKEGGGGGGGGGGIAAPPNAVATLPDNIKFVSPAGAVAAQGKDGKPKSKRSKNSKEAGAKNPGGADGSKKDPPGGRIQAGDPAGPTASGPNQNSNPPAGKGAEKSGNKASRTLPAAKKDKEGAAGGKNKKDKLDSVLPAGVNSDKEPVAPGGLPLGASVRGGGGAPFEPSPQNPEGSGPEVLGGMSVEQTGLGQNMAASSEPEDGDTAEGRNLKKAISDQMESSPVSTPAPPPLHLPPPPVGGAMSLSDISSPCEQMMVRTRSVAVNTADVALATEPECLGPCEPGTSVSLEGIVWQETEDGMLVVNVTWRNKTYVGTLLDCTRHDWAPPRFCESPTSDLEMRNGRGRGKRMRPNSNTPVNDTSTSSDNRGGSGSSKTRASSAAANSSKGRRGSQGQTSADRRTPPNSAVGGGGGPDEVKASPSSSSNNSSSSSTSAANKRKNKPPGAGGDMEPNSGSEDSKASSKRMRTSSNSTGATAVGGGGGGSGAAGGGTAGGGAAAAGGGGPMPPHAVLPLPNVKAEPLGAPPPPCLERSCPSPVLIDCPHPNCNKRYKHINGLKYHQARVHSDEHDVKLDPDGGDSEYGEDHPEAPAGCNGSQKTSSSSSLSPARSTTPKGGRGGFEAHNNSPSPGKLGKQGGGRKKTGGGEADQGELMDGCEEGPCLTDEASNDGTPLDDRKGGKKGGTCPKAAADGKAPQKGGGPKAAGRPPLSQAGGGATGPPLLPGQQQLYSLQPSSAFPPGGAFPPGAFPPGAFPPGGANNPNAASTGGGGSVLQPVPKSPQIKPPPPPPTAGDPNSLSPALGKDKKKKDKKKKEGREGDSPKGPGGGGGCGGGPGGKAGGCKSAEEGRSPYSEPCPGGADPSSKPSSDAMMLNGTSDPHQSRLASIKAEADKIYSFSDNAPSPSIGGGGSRMDPSTPHHQLANQNGGGGDNSSVKTNSPAYSDISDAGEDGEGRPEAGGVKAVKVEPDGGGGGAHREGGAKKALFPPSSSSTSSSAQPPPANKESPYYPGYDSYYSPSYPTHPGAHPSPGPGSGPPHVEGAQVKVKKEQGGEEEMVVGGGGGAEEVKVKMEVVMEERKAEGSVTVGALVGGPGVVGPGGPSPQQQQTQQQQQPSVIQQRSNMYMQPLYYNQYAYVPPYTYHHPDQAYHTHLMNTSPAYRQQYEERQRMAEQSRTTTTAPSSTAADKKPDVMALAMGGKERGERECPGKMPPMEEWKQKPSAPPTLSKAPSLPDLLGCKAGPPPPPLGGKANKDSTAGGPPPLASSEQPKSVIMPKGEEAKTPSQQAEGLKVKLSEASGHHGKDDPKPGMESNNRPSSMEQAMWYRQEPDSRLWPYVYPNKYPDTPKPHDEDRWKEERERDRERDRDRDRKGDNRKDDRANRPNNKDNNNMALKEEGNKEGGAEPRTQPSSSSVEEQQRGGGGGGGKEVRPPHMQFSSPLPQHQGYLPYMHGAYAYSQGYEPSHPGYRGMPSVMMQNYPGSYLSSGYSFSPYGGKLPPGEESGEKGSRASPTVSAKPGPDTPKALELLHQHASQYKTKSPTVPTDKPPHDARDRGGPERDRERDRERERERESERPRSSPSQRMLPSHHHLGYPLLSGQYDLSYATGLSSSAIVASQQGSAPSMYPPARR